MSKAKQGQSVGDNIHLAKGEWSFAGDVPRFFGQHVRRSVPLYDETHQLILAASDSVLKRGDRVYDLGCSTGTLTRLLAERHAELELDIVGLDYEADMVAAARAHTPHRQVSYGQADIADVALESCAMVVVCYTLQFAPPACRSKVLARIHKVLRPGGLLVLTEKLAFEDAQQAALKKALYYDYKRRQGYTEAEIAAKEASLEGVLRPATEQQNLQWLEQAGFQRVERFLQHSCFCGWLAHRDAPAAA